MTDDTGYEGEIVLDDPTAPGAPADAGTLTAKFVRYPGCQQLILWLPRDETYSFEMLRIVGPDGALIEDATVRSRLNGSIQILTDTYGWRPGPYRIEITHADGWRHELQLEKLEEGVAPPPSPAPPPEPVSDEPIVYRDGFGNLMPNLDLELRAQVLQRMADRFGGRLEFDGNARAGTIVYIEGDTRIRFPHERCFGRVKFSIDVPRAERWEAATSTPLAERDDIIEFVARETQRIQASSWRYEIHDDRIDFVG